MVSTEQISFLQNKIKEIGSAIFYNESEAVLKLPSTIVSTLMVDDFGYVWFFVHKPKQHLREFEQDFPVRMDFFKKGTNCFLQVEGRGCVVTDPEEVNTLLSLTEELQQVNQMDMVLVKVKIQKAEYYETKTAHNNSWWQTAVNTVSTWFRNTNQYKPNSTYFPAS
ncbi:MAG: pyridoxamine 5'-phosphate oxidase family protein [Candidatus Dadabacteria bacterium]